MDKETKTYKDILTEEEIALLMDADRKKALDALFTIRSNRFHGREIKQSLISHMKRYGVRQYKPAGMTWKQALKLRRNRASMQEAILCDYDGCGSPDSLHALISEAQTSYLEALVCFPEILRGGGGRKKQKSKMEERHGTLIYDLPSTMDDDWVDVIIPPYEYFLPDEAIADDEVDSLGVVEMACSQHRENQDLLWLVCDYKDKAHEADECVEGASNADREWLTVGRNVVDYYWMCGAPKPPEEYDADIYKQTDAQLVDVLTKAIGYADRMLAIAAKDRDAKFWMRAIDDMREMFIPFWQAYRELDI